MNGYGITTHLQMAREEYLIYIYTNTIRTGKVRMIIAFGLFVH